jgi:hypothetical protein
MAMKRYGGVALNFASTLQSFNDAIKKPGSNFDPGFL